MGKRIHIIDDDRFMLSLLSGALTKRGFEVSASSDSYKIFDISDNFPDLFIIDVVLPGLNGLETCKWIKSQNENVKVIILSGTPGLKVLAENSKADDFVQKPFELRSLVEKINRALSDTTPHEVD